MPYGEHTVIGVSQLVYIPYLRRIRQSSPILGIYLADHPSS